MIAKQCPECGSHSTYVDWFFRKGQKIYDCCHDCDHKWETTRTEITAAEELLATYANALETAAASDPNLFARLRKSEGTLRSLLGISLAIKAEIVACSEGGNDTDYYKLSGAHVARLNSILSHGATD